jgi:hypothetical protein
MRVVRLAYACLLVGCSNSGGGAPDLAVPDGGALTPTAQITSTPDLVGFVTRLDGTGSRDPAGRALTFAWHFSSVPAGSAITDASLSSTSSPTPTFEPDLGGAYGVSLTVTAPDGASGTASATATVPTWPLFYYRAQYGAGADTFSVGVVRSDGTGARAIDCALAAPVNDASPGYLLDLLELPGFFTMRVFDPAAAPATVPSALAFEQPIPAGTDLGAAGFRLLLADEQSDCASKPPVRLDDGSAAQHVEPRFSPDGSRLVYLDRGPDRVITVGRDGQNRHVVRTGAKIPGAAPLWVDATHVAWTEDTSANATPHLDVFSAADADGAGDAAGTRTTLLDCPAATDATALQVINQLELVGQAMLVAGGVKSKFASPPGSINLYRMAAPSCSTTAATRLASQLPGGDAWDFTVAPDGVTIAMSSTAGQTGPNPQHDILLLTIDGSLAPTVYAGSDPVLDDIGPRWIAHGRQLTWTQAAPPDDGGASRGGGIMIGNLNGTHVRSLVPQQSGAGGPTLIAGGSNRGLSCSWSGAGADAGAGASVAAMVLLLAITLARRTRRER